MGKKLNLKEYLPSGQFSKTALSLLVLAGLIGVALIYPEERVVKYSNQNAELEAGTLESIVSIAGNIDSDADGLKDWEEALFKSDPNNKDTDGDGTQDGEEVKLGRNPTVPGPKDQLPKYNAEGNSPESSFENLSATDKLARQLFAEYAQVKHSGGTIDAETQKRLIQSVINSAEDNKTIRLYTEGELVVVKDNSQLSLRKYASDMEIIQVKNAIPEGKDTELTTFNKALNGDNFSELKKLEPIAARYDTIVKSMLNTSVPKEVVPHHLNLLNAISSISQSVKEMSKLEADPLLAIGGFSQYVKTAKYIPEIYKNINKFYTDKKITLYYGEGGYYFVNLYK